MGNRIEEHIGKAKVEKRRKKAEKGRKGGNGVEKWR